MTLTTAIGRWRGRRVRERRAGHKNWRHQSFGALASCVAVCAVGVSPASAAGGLRPITVDASKGVGIFRSLQGVSGTPLPGDNSHGDFTQQFQQLGVDIVRTHDVDCAGTTDIDGAGPNRIFPNWNANPNDPSSYNFAPSDRALLSIARSGAQIEYNLGHSDLLCAGVATNNTPPPDPALYATVASHVAQHYNDGWDNGYHLHIRYWEIWNEPDLLPFWSGNTAQFYALYADTALALKSLHRWMRVGGPALATDNDLTGYRQSLLAYIRDRGLPLDFYSVHQYTEFTEDPFDTAELASESRALLDSYGFTHTKIQLNEWNYGYHTARLTDPESAAYTADALIYMQDAPVQRAMFYRADPEKTTKPVLINNDGTLTKRGDAFAAVGSMNTTPLRLATTGGDLNGLAVEAGRSRQEHGQIRVLISNYEIPAADQGPFPPFIQNDMYTFPHVATFTVLPRRPVSYVDNSGYDLTVNHIRGGERRVLVSRYRIDDGHDLSLIDQSVQGGPTVHVSAGLAAPSVELVVISPANGADR